MLNEYPPLYMENAKIFNRYVEEYSDYRWTSYNINMKSENISLIITPIVIIFTILYTVINNLLISIWIGLLLSIAIYPLFSIIGRWIIYPLLSINLRKPKRPEFVGHKSSTLYWNEQLDNFIVTAFED